MSEQEKLEAYVALLLKWNASINLIGKTSEAQIWSRHIADCQQLFTHIPPETTVITDLGSGGGLPGVVLAIHCEAQLHLVESDQRKCIFLNEVKRALSLDNMMIHHARVESLEPWQTDIITARAFAPLPELCDYMQPFFGTHTRALLLKGRGVDDELADAQKRHEITYEKHASALSDGCVLDITKLG